MENGQVDLNKPSQQPGGSNYASSYAEPPQKKKGLAIAALILGIVSLIGLCCCLNIITAPVGIILAIIALAKKQGGTGMSVTGLVFSLLSLLVVFAAVFSFRDFYPYAETIANDYQMVVENQDEVFKAYEKDSTLPEYLEKYKEPPYSDLLAKYEITIYDVMDALLTQYKSGQLQQINVPQTSSGSAFALPLWYESIPAPAA